MYHAIRLLSVFGTVCVLSACGVRGDLERPPPVWGEDLRTDEEREYERDEESTNGETR